MKCGLVAIVGRPNVGKSTLINLLAGKKVSIVSRRRQTTRGIVRAVCEYPQARLMLLDSPGWQNTHSGELNRMLNVGALWAVESADVVVWMLTPRQVKEDLDFLDRIPKHVLMMAVINKIDLLSNKRELLPLVDRLRQRRDFFAIVPLCAIRGEGVAALVDEIIARLPKSPALLVDNDDVETHDFLLAELLREKIFRMLGDELPYRIGVTANQTKSRDKEKLMRVEAQIYVERESQKAVVIGKGGAMLKKLATAARRDMEIACRRKIFLDVRVRVRPDWARDTRLLSQMRIGAPL